MHKIGSLQALRFFAALMVVQHHAASVALNDMGSEGVFAMLNGVGAAGVDVFFVISGFIITLTSTGLSAGEFVARRVRRIWPIYLLLSAPWIALHAASGTVGWRDILSTLALWPVTDRITRPILIVGWTLCYEVLFYAAAALVIWKPRALWPLLGAYLLALAVHRGPLLQYLGNPLVLEFLAGAALARLHRWKPAVLALPLGLGLLALAASQGWVHPTTVEENLAGVGGWVRILAYGLPAVLIVWGALQLDVKRGALTYLGDASYSLYLVHPLVVMLVFGAVRLSGLPVPPEPFVLACMGASVLAAWRIYELVERPILKAQPKALAA